MLNIYDLVCQSHIVKVVIGFVDIVCRGYMCDKSGTPDRTSLCSRCLLKASENRSHIFPSSVSLPITYKEISQCVKEEAIHVLSGKRVGVNECRSTKSIQKSSKI